MEQSPMWTSQSQSTDRTKLMEQLHSICSALPECRGLSRRFSHLSEEAMADLYIALLDMSNRYCSLCFPETAPNPSRVSGTSLAKYLFTHPDRCRETLEALGNPDKTHPLLQALCRFNGQPTPGR